MVHVTFLTVILTQPALAIILNQENIIKGYCEQDQTTIKIKTECDVSTIDVSIRVQQDDFQTLIVHCSKGNDSFPCVPFANESAIYDARNQTLEISFEFKHREHAGKYVNVMTTFQNTTQINDHVLLTPCYCGFTRNISRDGDKLTVSCQHPSFKQSVTGMSIGNNGNEFLQCLVNECQGENETEESKKDLPNGFSLQLAYQPGMTLLCKMDGAVISFTDLINSTTLASYPTTSPRAPPRNMTTNLPTAVDRTEDNSASHPSSEHLLTCSIVASLILFITL